MLRKLLQFVRLTFRAPDPFEPYSTEQEFLRDYAQRFLAQRRAISIMAVVYWSAYAASSTFLSVQTERVLRVAVGRSDRLGGGLD